MKSKSSQPVDLGFQPDFLECLAVEAFSILHRELSEPLRGLAENAHAIYSLLLIRAEGGKISEMTLKEIPDMVGELTKQIWEAGGEFGNSVMTYRKD